MSNKALAKAHLNTQKIRREDLKRKKEIRLIEKHIVQHIN